MADLNERDTKLVQYLNEAYGKEKQLETALEAHIAMTTRAPYKKRLQQHLKETKAHGRDVERRIKQLGGQAGADGVAGAANTLQTAANKAAALAQGPLHMARGTGEQEKLLKNAKTEYQDEAEEIATYTAIETLATTVGDKETAQLAKRIRREEERMSGFLERLIPQLTKAVATAEIPASQRSTGRRKRSSSSSRSRSGSTSSRSRSGSSSRSGSTSSRSRSGSTSRSSSSRSTASRSSGSRSKASRSSGSRSTGSRSTASRNGSSRSGSRSSGGSRSGSSRSGGSRARARS
jgi:ferritin-like metal-binding protein YciE